MDSSESNLDYRSRVNSKARELVNLSKIPREGLETNPSEARSIEKALEEGNFEDVEMYFCELARYEKEGVLAFCNWLSEYCPNMLSHNHTMWIMMEEDGVDFEKIREVYLKVDYDIENVEKEVIIDINKISSTSEVRQFTLGFFKVFMIIIILSLSYWYLLDHNIRGETIGFEEEVSGLSGKHAIYVSSNGFDCNEDLPIVQYWNYNKEQFVELPSRDWDDSNSYSSGLYLECFSVYDKPGYTFIGFVNLNEEGKYRIDPEFNVSESKFLSSPITGSMPPIAFVIVVPVAITFFFGFLLLMKEEDDERF